MEGHKSPKTCSLGLIVQSSAWLMSPVPGKRTFTTLLAFTRKGAWALIHELHI